MRLSKLVTTAASLASSSPGTKSHALKLFTLGDSYSTTHFDSSSTQPSLDNPMGNPKLGEGTSAGGPNWVGFVTTTFNATPILSYDFAVWGAAINNSIFREHDLVPHDLASTSGYTIFQKDDLVRQDLVYQVTRDFSKHYCSSIQQEADPSPPETSTLFAIWMGINDIHLLYQSRNPLLIIDQVVESYFNLLTNLYGCNARNFLIINIPPVTRTPQMQIKPHHVQSLHRNAVRLFNSKLMSAIEEWRLSHENMTVQTYDSHEFFNKILDHPREYGFEEDPTCIGRGCIWWDDYHPMTKFHELLAQDMSAKIDWQLILGSSTTANNNNNNNNNDDDDDDNDKLVVEKSEAEL